MPTYAQQAPQQEHEQHHLMPDFRVEDGPGPESGPGLSNQERLQALGLARGGDQGPTRLRDKFPWFGAPERQSIDLPSTGEMTPAWVEENRDVLGLPPGAPVEHFLYEYVSKNIAYRQGADGAEVPAELGQGDADLLRAWGYDPNVQWLNGENDMQVLTINPLLPEGATQGEDGRWSGPDGNALPAPIMAFRGTSGGEDFLTDIDPQGVGHEQYTHNREAIDGQLAALTEAYGPAVLTGHSLGGALSGTTAANNTDRVQEIVNFQPAGLEEPALQRLEAAGVPGTNYTAGGDVVPLSGDGHAPGPTYHYELGQANPVRAHLAMFMAPKTDPQGNRVAQESWTDVGEWNQGTWDLSQEGGRDIATESSYGIERHDFVPGDRGSNDPAAGWQRTGAESVRWGAGQVRDGVEWGWGQAQEGWNGLQDWWNGN
ncbi:MAG: hypothetical protein H6739_17360 [Alphaproteobacteria bacterium]|nr:hypothetical protein [Alphaproteobacteria bacterium]